MNFPFKKVLGSILQDYRYKEIWFHFFLHCEFLSSNFQFSNFRHPKTQLAFRGLYKGKKNQFRFERNILSQRLVEKLAHNDFTNARRKVLYSR